MLGFGCSGLVFGVWGSGWMGKVWVLAFRGWDIMVWGLAVATGGLRFEVCRLGFGVWGLGVGFGVWVWGCQLEVRAFCVELQW